MKQESSHDGEAGSNVRKVRLRILPTTQIWESPDGVPHHWNTCSLGNKTVRKYRQNTSITIVWHECIIFAYNWSEVRTDIHLNYFYEQKNTVLKYAARSYIFITYNLISMLKIHITGLGLAIESNSLVSFRNLKGKMIKPQPLVGLLPCNTAQNQYFALGLVRVSIARQ